MSKIKVAMMQPTFLPWLGYFELMLNVDVFVFCDDFQFVSRSWHQHNRLFLNKNTSGLVTVPVRKKGLYQQNINEVQIREDLPWRSKLWRSIEVNYCKATYFEEYAPIFKTIILGEQSNLAVLDMELCKAMAKLIGCTCEFKTSSLLKGTGKRSYLVKDLLVKVGADVFYQARGAFEYMSEESVFPLSNVTVLFQNAEVRPYRQIGSNKGFVPYMSALDALFNIGGVEANKIASSMTKQWLSWDEMMKLK